MTDKKDMATEGTEDRLKGAAKQRLDPDPGVDDELTGRMKRRGKKTPHPEQSEGPSPSTFEEAE